MALRTLRFEGVFLELRIESVLDSVVGPPWESLGDLTPLVSELRMHAEDGLVL